MKARQELMWYGLGGMVLGVGLYFTQPYISLITPFFVKSVFGVGVVLLVVAGLMKLVVAGKEFFGEIRGHR